MRTLYFKREHRAADFRRAYIDAIGGFDNYKDCNVWLRTPDSSLMTSSLQFNGQVDCSIGFDASIVANLLSEQDYGTIEL